MEQLSSWRHIQLYAGRALTPSPHRHPTNTHTHLHVVASSRFHYVESKLFYREFSSIVFSHSVQPADPAPALLIPLPPPPPAPPPITIRSLLSWERSRKSRWNAACGIAQRVAKRREGRRFAGGSQLVPCGGVPAGRLRPWAVSLAAAAAWCQARRWAGLPIRGGPRVQPGALAFHFLPSSSFSRHVFRFVLALRNKC